MVLISLPTIFFNMAKNVEMNTDMGLDVAIVDNSEVIDNSTVVEKEKDNFDIKWCSEVKCKNNHIVSLELSFFSIF